MQFNSPAYLFFLILVFTFYISSPGFTRPYILVFSSFLFYASFSLGNAIIFFLAIPILYWYSIFLSRRSPRWQGLGLIILVSTLISVLFFSKYLTAFQVFLSGFALRSDTEIGLSLPVFAGISFISFHLMSYFVDISNGEKPAKSLLDFYLYISFFPKVLQGPIERRGNFLSQLDCYLRPSLVNIYRSLLYIMWGLFMKVVLADRLSIYINAVYANETNSTSVSHLFALLAYPFALFFDFEGYTKIAIGSSLLFGIELTPNFNNPFAAISCTDFWRRWHISLSSFLRDYLFLPISYNLRRQRYAGPITATLITFAIAGAWHGPTIGYLFFGIYHGIWLSLELGFRMLRFYPLRGIGLIGFENFIMRPFTYLSLCVSFAFFRAPDIHIAINIIKASLLQILLVFNSPFVFIGSVRAFLFNESLLGLTTPALAFNMAALTLGTIIVVLSKRYKLLTVNAEFTTPSHVLFLPLITFLVCSLGLISNSKGFAYFEF